MKHTAIPSIGKLTLDRLSETTGISRRLLLDALKDRERPLPCYRLTGKTILIDLTEFEEWLQPFRVRKDSQIDALVDSVLEGM